jgi:hypothetical protein
MFRSDPRKKLDDFYVSLCLEIDKFLSTHTLSEYEKLIVTEKKHPIIGLHGTTKEALISIFNNGFNPRHPGAVIYGEVEDHPTAMFASPYILGDRIYKTSQYFRNPNHHISFRIGYVRNIERIVFRFFDKYGVDIDRLKREYPELFYHDYITFPIIISAFKKSEGRIEVDDFWISTWNPDNHVIILGVVHVKFTIDDIVDRYKKHDDYLNFDKVIDYEIVWEKNIKQEYFIINFITK